jgi:hypothetical protein
MISKDIFKAMYLKKCASVETCIVYILNQDPGGNVGWVPGHIRGCSNNAMHVITKIEREETKKWKAMTANVKQVYKYRIS